MNVACFNIADRNFPSPPELTVCVVISTAQYEFVTVPLLYPVKPPTLDAPVAVTFPTAYVFVIVPL